MSSHVPVSTLTVGDVILRKGGAPLTITRLEPLPHSGRTRIWVKGNGQRWSQVSESNFGQFRPTDTVEVRE